MPELNETFARWGITPEEAERAGIYGVDDASTVDPSYPAEPAVVLPYYTLDGEPLIVNGVPFTRIRRLTAPAVIEGFRAQRVAKYLQPPNTGVQIYFPRVGGNWRDVANNVSIPIVITEGEAKALASSLRYAPTIALGGVYSFTDTNGRLHPSLAAINWTGRDVYVIYDSDAAYNTQVAVAESRLADELFYKLRAKLKIIRLPSGPNESKVGLDDYLRLFGAEALQTLVRATPTLLALDGKILSLNANIVWVEYERMVYDVKSRMWIPKDALVVGSKYSAETIASPSADGRTMTKKSLAKAWLTHPLARRVDEVLFRPGEGPYVQGENMRVAMNLWEPLPIVEGPVEPFLRLTEHLVAAMPPKDRELPLKLLAYKTQNPQSKPPLALVFVGGQGSGKTLWSEIVREAFGPYGVPVTPKSLASEFQGWLETALIATINEIAPKELAPVREKLKTLISDLRQPMNEKYRQVRDVNSYTLYIITSNKRGVGAYEFDDRRMIVIDTPPKREPEFYDDVKRWRQNGGAKFLYAYLMNMDLQGWTPPSSAPMTPEKYMAYVESLTPVQRLAEDMRNTESTTVVKAWLDKALAWAESMEVSQNAKLAGMASAIVNNIRQYQIRPWYMPEELTTMFPAIAVQFMGAEAGQPSPGRMSQELRENGIPYLINQNDPRGFRYRGRIVQFLVVAQFDRWREAISQAEFDEYMRSWPTYGQILTTPQQRG
jgi:hypothetical protein